MLVRVVPVPSAPAATPSGTKLKSSLPSIPYLTTLWAWSNIGIGPGPTGCPTTVWRSVLAPEPQPNSLIQFGSISPVAPAGFENLKLDRDVTASFKLGRLLAEGRSLKLMPPSEPTS